MAKEQSESRASLGCPCPKPPRVGLQAKRLFAKGSGNSCKCLEQAGRCKRKSGYVIGTDFKG